MARRMESSGSKSMGSWGIEEVPEEEGIGKETGLPLIQCPTCGRARVIELRAVTNENGNQDRVFFKCPRNIRGMVGRCTFFEFQKSYLKVLVKKKFVFIDLEAALGGEVLGGEEAQSKVAGESSNNGSLDLKMETLISLLKTLIVVVFVFSIVGIINLVK